MPGPGESEIRPQPQDITSNIQHEAPQPFQPTLVDVEQLREKRSLLENDPNTERTDIYDGERAYLTEIMQLVSERQITAEEAADLMAVRNTEIQKRVSNLERHALLDEETDLLNGRGFQRTLFDSVEASTRTGRSLVLGSVTLDGFDELRASLPEDLRPAAANVIGGYMQSLTRSGQDWAGRMGDNEFSFIFTEQDPAEVEAKLKQQQEDEEQGITSTVAEGMMLLEMERDLDLSGFPINMHFGLVSLSELNPDIDPDDRDEGKLLAIERDLFAVAEERRKAAIQAKEQPNQE